MRQFASSEELVSSLSVFLLIFGLGASMTKVLTKRLILTDNRSMQVIWSASERHRALMRLSQALSYDVLSTIEGVPKLQTASEDGT